MSKSEAKKHHIVDKGLEVMKSQGYNGTSVKDIVDAAAVPKGSFYNYFDSKETFAMQAIEKAAAESHSAMSQMLHGSDESPRDKLKRFFETNICKSCDSEFYVGCFIGNMCQEMADKSDRIRNTIDSVLTDMIRLIETVLAQAKQQDELKTDVDVAVLAEFLFNAWEGALMRVKASKSRDALDAFYDVLNTFFKPAA